jgi:hypothetical protein
MNLSELKENDVGKIDKEIFIVIRRVPEDRGSGITDIIYKDGSQREFIWDFEDPEVTLIGKGHLEIVID